MITSFLNLLPEFVQDAFLDSVRLIPALLFIFVVIEIFENYFANKITSFAAFSKKIGPILGTFLAIIPQCGFSVVMTTLFIKKFISLGTLISVYIATSDEAIPVLLANPTHFHTVVKIVLIKLFVAIIAGYCVDLIFPNKTEQKVCDNVEPEHGCCDHEITGAKIKNIVLHPIKHTVNIFLFIFLICIGLNYLFLNVGEDTLGTFVLSHSAFQPVIFAFFGLIPNCAVSVLITMLYLKGLICFASVIAGLTSNAGLGLVVLFAQKENWKTFLNIIVILFTIAVITGLLMYFVQHCLSFV